jgi:anti-sigma factor RsiW
VATCRQIRNRFPDLDAGHLPPQEAAGVEEHLRACAACRTEREAGLRLAALLSGAGAVEPPPGLFNRVRAEIESGALPQLARPWWYWWLDSRPARGLAVGMAAAALALGLILPTGSVQLTGEPLEMHPAASVRLARGGRVTSSALAGSIRQHAMSAGAISLPDRVAWEATAQLVLQRDGEREPVRRP